MAKPIQFYFINFDVVQTANSITTMHVLRENFEFGEYYLQTVYCLPYSLPIKSGGDVMMMVLTA